MSKIGKKERNPEEATDLGVYKIDSYVFTRGCPERN